MIEELQMENRKLKRRIKEFEDHCEVLSIEVELEENNMIIGENPATLWFNQQQLLLNRKYHALLQVVHDRGSSPL